MTSRALALAFASALAVLAASCAESESGSGSDGGTDEVAAASSGTGSEAPACEPFPDGPYGNTEGTYMPADVVVEGLLEGETERTSIRLGDLRDCDGRTGVGALYFIAARVTCSVCNREAPDLNADLAELRERGVRVVILMMDGEVEAWRRAYGLEDAVVVADLDETFYVDGNNVFSDEPNGTPLNVVVDARTGLIVERDLGGSFDREPMFELAAANLGE